MGTNIFDALIVTSFQEENMHRAHTAAISVFGPRFVTPIGGDLVNGFRSFTIYPTGSSYGWPESNRHRLNLASYSKWLITNRHLGLIWIALVYGEIEPRIVDGSHVVREEQPMTDMKFVVELDQENRAFLMNVLEDKIKQCDAWLKAWHTTPEERKQALEERDRANNLIEAL